MEPLHPPAVLPMKNLENYFVDKPRMEIKAEIATLQHAIDQFAMHDELSEQLALWNHKFHEALKLKDGDLKVTVDTFTEMLQRILSSPLPPYYAPLDRKPLLGSDGHTYGTKALHVFNAGEGVFLHRSPLAQHDETPFHVKPHPLASVFIEWLVKHQAFLQSIELEQRFNELLHANALRPLPIEKVNVRPEIDPRIEEMAARAQKRRNAQLGFNLNAEIKGVFDQREAAANEAQQNLLQKIEKPVLQIDAAKERLVAVQQGMQGLQQQNALNKEQVEHLAYPVDQQALDNRRAARILKNYQNQARQRGELVQLVNQLNKLPNPVKQALAPVQLGLAERFLAQEQRVEGVEENAKRQVEQLQEEILKNKVNEIEKQIEDLEKRNQELRERQLGLDERMHAAEIANTQITIQINQVEKAIKERQRTQTKGLISTLMQIGACSIATWGVSSILQGVVISPFGPGVSGLRLAVEV